MLICPINLKILAQYLALGPPQQSLADFFGELLVAFSRVPARVPSA